MRKKERKFNASKQGGHKVIYRGESFDDEEGDCREAGFAEIEEEEILSGRIADREDELERRRL